MIIGLKCRALHADWPLGMEGEGLDSNFRPKIVYWSLVDIALILQQNRLRWYGHVLRKDDDDWVKKCMEYEVGGSRPRGRPKRTWKEVVREDCQARKLNKEDAVDRCKWRKVIKEVRWPGWVWASECFFWYWPTRVVPDKRPLNGCCCRLQSMVYNATLHFKCLHLFILIPGINVS